MNLRVKIHLIVVCLLPAPLMGEDVSQTVRDLIVRHCADCHVQNEPAGGLDLRAVSGDLEERSAREIWIRIHDRIQSGEMPPSTARRENDDPAEIVELLAPLLQAVDGDEVRREGRGLLRRLTRGEYQQTLRDLLHLPDLDIQDLLPEDGRGHGFRRSASTLDLSRVQLAAILTAAELALNEAAAVPDQTEPAEVYRADGRSLFAAASTFGGREAMFFARDGRGISAAEAETTIPEFPVEMAVFRSAHWPYYGYPQGFRASRTGRYRIRFSARSVLQQPGFVLIPAKRTVPMTFRARKASGPDVSGDVRATGGWLDIEPQQKQYETEILLKAGETFEYSVLGLPVPLARNIDGGPPEYRYPPFPSAGQPGVAFQWLEAEGLLTESEPLSYRTLFDHWGPQTWPGPGEQTAEARRLLRRFADRAALSPMPESDLEPFTQLTASLMDGGQSFRNAMLTGYQALLASGHVLYLNEPRFFSAPEERSFAIANRLAYFLTSTAPDAELRRFAAAGQLASTERLLEQVERLMAGAGFERFVRDFSDDWLDVNQVRRNEPDQLLYPEYRFDDYLLESMQRETLAFVKDLFRGNQPVRGLITADYAWVNDRLSEHYGLPPQSGSQMRKVLLPVDSVRGGLLTQATSLRVTSGGGSTSPVVRGVWVLERLLGQSVPPPPPGIAAISPDLRGARGIREILHAHLNDSSCAVCHREIDPLGLALENFDVCGSWRERYRGFGAGDQVVGIDRAGHDFEFALKAAVDSRGALSDGRSFDGVRQLQELLAADERGLAQGFVHKLVTYSTGTPVRFSDRQAVEVILDSCESSGYRCGDLLRQVVLSPIFCGKELQP